MFSVIHYISASRRLKESDKTIYMLGGRSECDAMILAQNEMIKLEKEYYRDESVKLGLYAVAFLMISLFVFTFYMKVINA
jgi:hypothetical protein